MRTLPRRLLLSIVPALLLAAVVSSVVWGENGLLVRHQLHAQLREAQVEVMRLDRANEGLLHDLRAMEQDPVVLERLVADELHWGRADAMLVRFDESEGAAIEPASAPR